MASGGTPEDRLRWVQRNRCRRERARPLGQEMGRVVGGLIDGAAATAEVVSDVAEKVDQTFKEHCRLNLTESGELLVSVDDPAWIDPLRRRWQRRLTEVRGIRRVRFQPGSGGFAIP